MTYELPPFRPPSEALSLLVRATRNCPWNRCAFCRMHKEGKFELRPVEEVRQDILALRALADEVAAWAQAHGYGDRVGEVARANGIPWLSQGRVTTAFIGDSNSLVMPTDDLVEIVSFLYASFPTLERVTSYGRAHTLLRKKPEELRRLREAGLNRLHVGLETGDDELLRLIEKGASAEEMVTAGLKAKEAGFELSEYIMPGLGGQGRWEQHAQGTAQVLNRISPHFIRLRTLGLAPDTPLFDMAQAGQFQVQTLGGLLEEVRLLVSELEATSYLVASDFSANYYLPGVDGQLPQDKARMLQAIDAVREQVAARGLAGRRVGGAG